MKEQLDLRMPATGECWRHYKGGLYTIIGMAVNEDGDPIVVYTTACWKLVQLPLLFTQPLARFLQHLSKESHGERLINVPRFVFEKEAGFDPDCPFIHPVTGKGWRELKIPSSA